MSRNEKREKKLPGVMFTEQFSSILLRKPKVS